MIASTDRSSGLRLANTGAALSAKLSMNAGSRHENIGFTLRSRSVC